MSTTVANNAMIVVSVRCREEFVFISSPKRRGNRIMESSKWARRIVRLRCPFSLNKKCPDKVTQIGGNYALRGYSSATVMRSLLTPRLTFNPRVKALKFTAYAKGLPVDTAFQVFVRIKGTEYPMGGIYIHNSSLAASYHSTSTNKIPAELPSHTDVILRSSEAVARQTAGITRIWKGEIVFRDLPIERVEP